MRVDGLRPRHPEAEPPDRLVPPFAWPPPPVRTPPGQVRGEPATGGGNPSPTRTMGAAPLRVPLAEPHVLAAGAMGTGAQPAPASVAPESSLPAPRVGGADKAPDQPDRVVQATAASRSGTATLELRTETATTRPSATGRQAHPPPADDQGTAAPRAPTARPGAAGQACAPGAPTDPARARDAARAARGVAPRGPKETTAPAAGPREGAHTTQGFGPTAPPGGTSRKGGGTASPSGDPGGVPTRPMAAATSSPDGSDGPRTKIRQPSPPAATGTDGAAGMRASGAHMRAEATTPAPDSGGTHGPAMAQQGEPPGADGPREAVIRLPHTDAGALQARVRVDATGVHLHLRSDSAQGQQQVVAALPRLVAELARHEAIGMPVTVSTGTDSGSGQPRSGAQGRAGHSGLADEERARVAPGGAARTNPRGHGGFHTVA